MPAGCVLPVHGAPEVLGLIEIEVDERTRPRAKSPLLTGMMRIYRSHLAALDYGDIDELTAARQSPNVRRSVRPLRARRGAPQRRAGGSTIFLNARAHLGVADIDFFKQVNDRFGHPYGDEVLVLFAGLMRETFRESDKLFRFGGEEFVILMSNCCSKKRWRRSSGFAPPLQPIAFPQVGAG